MRGCVRAWVRDGKKGGSPTEYGYSNAGKLSAGREGGREWRGGGERGEARQRNARAQY